MASEFETFRCPCGRLHQVPRKIDPAGELHRARTQRDAYWKQMERQRTELTQLRNQVEKWKAKHEAELKKLRDEYEHELDMGARATDPGA